MCICVHLWSVFLERIRAQFGKQAEVYARMRQTTDERSLNALVQLTGADADARVLDVACGPGFLTMAFAARWRSAVAFDATEQFLAIARVETEHRGLRNIEFRYGPIVGITGKVYVSPVLRRPGVSLGQA